MIPPRYRPSKRVVFATLMGVSLVLVLLPVRFKLWIGGIAQPLTWPAQIVATIRSSVRAWNLPDPEDVAVLAGENERLRRQVAEQSLRISELERQIDEVTHLARQLADDRATLVVAQVLARPTQPRRETLTLGRGGKVGIREGDWVLAGAPLEERHVESGRERMSRAWVVGRITSVQPYRSTVTLATDPLFGRIAVRIARRLDDGRLQLVERDDVLLQGEGGGRMRVPGSEVDFFSTGHRVVLATIPTTLPTLLPIGEIVGSRTTPQSSLHFDLDVTPVGDALSLTHVYVVSFLE
ncbi:MAG: hypothetical protein AMXMBFR47_28160 [Planctomycetota bacterium]